MGLSRVTPHGWLEETGTLSRVTPFGWVHESQSGGASNDSLTPSGITSGTPTLGSPTVTQDHVLTAQSIVSGLPALGQPSIPTDSNDELTASGVESGSPVVGIPVLTAGILGANIPTEGEHGGSPVPNDFTISPTALYSWEVVTPPSAGTLEIFADLTFEWDAAGVPDGDYSWDYRLYENSVSVGTATVYMHVGALAVNGIVAGIPVLGQPTLTEIGAGVISPVSIATGSPILGTPTLTQNQALVGGAIACGAPVFGQVTLDQQHAMMASGVTSGTPILSTPTLTAATGETWPTVSDVRLGVTYGPTGTEYTGTMTVGTGPSAESIAAAVLAALQGTTIPVNIKQVNDVSVQGTGTKLNPWKPV